MKTNAIVLGGGMIGATMARTTGFPAVILARMPAGGMFTDPGVFPPESLPGGEKLFNLVVAELATHGVELSVHEQQVVTQS